MQSLTRAQAAQDPNGERSPPVVDSFYRVDPGLGKERLMQSGQREQGYAVEPATMDDQEAVVALFAEDLHDLGQRSVDVAALAGVYRALLAEPRATVLVVRAMTTGAAVGVLVANELLSVKFAGRSLWIEELYVGKRWRRRGLGRVLVEGLLDRARGTRINGIDLEAYQGNAPAGILYRSLGFRRLGRERFHYRFDWEDEEETA